MIVRSGFVWLACLLFSLPLAAADTARGQARDLLASAKPAVGSVQSGKSTLYRARLTGLSRDTAVQACDRIAKGRGGCMVLSPNAQS